MVSLSIFRTWKTLLKDAAKTTGMVILSFVVVTLIAFILFGGLFRLFGWSGFMAFIISLLFAYTVKYAFIDSWILVKMMSSYMQVAPATQVTFDRYFRSIRSFATADTGTGLNAGKPLLPSMRNAISSDRYILRELRRKVIVFKFNRKKSRI